MDNVPQQQPNEQKPNLLKEFEFGVGGVLLGIGTFLLMLFVLNYFNLVSLSLVFPKYFGFLPHRASPNPPAGGEGGPASQGEALQGRLPSPTPTSVKITLSCPVPKEFCNQATIIKEGDFAGIGYNLPKETSLSAVFDGTLSDQPKPTGRLETQPLIYLRDNQGNEVIYSFYGTSSASLISQTVAKGTEVGIIGEGTFPPYPPLAGLNFLFTVKREGKTIPINPDQFVE